MQIWYKVFTQYITSCNPITSVGIIPDQYDFEPSLKFHPTPPDALVPTPHVSRNWTNVTFLTRSHSAQTMAVLIPWQSLLGFQFSATPTAGKSSWIVMLIWHRQSQSPEKEPYWFFLYSDALDLLRQWCEIQGALNIPHKLSGII